MGVQCKPTYNRQRYLLAFLNKINEPLQMTYIQKLVFLNEQKSGKDYYDFIPYKYGPYSFQLAEDLDIMNKKGFISQNNGRFYSLTSIEYEDIEPIASERGNELIKKAYIEYPYYAKNSEIIEKLFCKDEVMQFKQYLSKKKYDSPMLFTIGYEGRSLESFINTLIENNIYVLCDVRKNPLSRKFGFSIQNLSHILPQVGIHYFSIPGLGIDSENRANLETVEDYKQLFCEYEKTMEKRTVFLNEVYNLYKQYHRVALMCFEKDPEMCHRHVVRDYMEQNYQHILCWDL